MDKAKTNSLIAIIILIILCVALIGYSATLNTQLGSEKTKLMQLNNQILGLDSKVKDLQAKLDSANSQVNNQTNIANNLQNALNVSNQDLNNLRAAYADIETKLKEAVAKTVSEIKPEAQEAVTGAVPSVAPVKR